jgi:cobyrinic acid a,c-diamide synthase
LIIADERRPGKVSSGVIISSVLKEMGYKLKLFVGSVDETTLRLLQAMCNQSVTMLDPILCDGPMNLKWLFQSAASPDCLNLIITSLGSKMLEDAPFKISKECMLLAEWLNCDVIPVVYGDKSATLTIRVVGEVMRQFEDSKIIPHSILFSSVLNNREYDLVDREIGRRFTMFSMGSIQNSIERDNPHMHALCGDSVQHAILPIRSAVKQILHGAEQQAMWPVLSAFAQNAATWPNYRRLCEPITESGKVNIVVLRHHALSLGGDGTEHLMKALGCNVVDMPLECDNTHIPIHGVYIPHGLAYMVLAKLFNNPYLKLMLTIGSSTRRAFLFAEGASSSIFGERIILPSDMGEARGLGVLPYNSVYEDASLGASQKVVAMSRKLNPLLSGGRECAWGYRVANYSLAGAGPGDEECWDLKDSPDGKKVGKDGWSNDRILATAMRLEPWSAPESFRRWLEG